MARQIYNTSGKTLNEIRQILEEKKRRNRQFWQGRIELSRQNIDRQIYYQQRNEQEIVYLEKFVTRKEKAITIEG